MSRLLATIGIVLTIAYLCLIAWLFWGRGEEITKMAPNNIGDLLAGAFGPLAVLWLILGFFQQGLELRVNTKVLELQAAELRNSVEQQRALVEATLRQVETEREAVEFERQRHIRASQPVFMVSCASVTKSSEDVSYQLHIHNSGAAASRVAIEFIPPLVRAPWYIEHFISGTTHQTIARFENGHPATGDKVKFSYTDRDNQARQVYFSIMMDGEIPKFLVLPP